MKLILAASAFLFSASTFAAILQLNDGLFNSPGYCSVNVINDQGTGNIVIQNISTNDVSCDSSGSLDNYPRLGDTLYGSDDVTTVDANWLKKCAPTKANKAPCDAWYYDNKGLIAQLNDKIVAATRIIVLNPAAFEFSYETTMNRAGAVVKSKGDHSLEAYVQHVPRCDIK